MIEYTPKNIMDWTRMGMRTAFGHFMKEIAGEYSNLIVLAADLASSSGLTEFQKVYPEKFYNIGIAEQNMTAIAAGLAKEGSNVFITSFAPFVSMRNYEAVRTLVGYMNLNVKIVALASGFSLGVQGNTHYCLEDISLMKTIPGMKIFSPADVVEESKCLKYLADYEGPAYLRLTGTNGSPAVFKADYEFHPEEPAELREGSDVLVLSTGSVGAECVRASRLLGKENISCGVYSCCQLKPFNMEFLRKKAEGVKLIATVEEHFRTGGLGGIVCEEMCSMQQPKPVLRIGVDDEFPKAGDYTYLQNETGLSSAKIASAVAEHLREFYAEVE